MDRTGSDSKACRPVLNCSPSWLMSDERNMAKKNPVHKSFSLFCNPLFPAVKYDDCV